MVDVVLCNVNLDMVLIFKFPFLHTWMCVSHCSNNADS